MVNKSGACPQPPVRPEPKMPPIEPLVSVKSVNGMTGDVVLKDLIIGEKVYNGSDQKAIYASDIYRGKESETQLAKAFVYGRAVSTKAAVIAIMEEAECGDVCYCNEDKKFYLSVGEGEYKTFSDGTGGEPEKYLKDAEVAGAKLVITKKDGSVVEFEADLSSKLDKMPGDEHTGGNAYNLPYFFYIEEGADGIKVHAKTVTLDGNKVYNDYSLDVTPATSTKAGLLSAADKAKVDSALQPGALAAYRTAAAQDVIDEEQNAEIARKQPAITDLETIRNGAALGATAVQPAALAEYRKTADQAIKDSEQDTAIAAKQNKLVAGSNIIIDEATNTIHAICEAGIPGVYLGSVVRDSSKPLPQKNLIGLQKDPDVDLTTLYETGYSNYIADNYSCTCFAVPQVIGALVSITMNDTPFEMLSSFNREEYTAKDGTKFYIYTYNQIVAPDYNKYTLKWRA